MHELKSISEHIDTHIMEASHCIGYTKTGHNFSHISIDEMVGIAQYVLPFLEFRI